MNTGILTRDSLTQILRHISQARKQGVLEIKNQQSAVALLFGHGKVVGVIEADKTPAVAVASRMVRSGVISETGLVGMSEWQGSLIGLYEATSRLTNNLITKNIFEKIVEQYYLSTIYNLSTSGDAIFSFKSQIVRTDPEFNVAISVGRILLDLAEADEVEETFNASFPANYYIAATDDLSVEGRAISDEERLLLAMLASPKQVQAFIDNTLFSRLFLKKTLALLSGKALVLLSERPSMSIQQPSQDLTAAYAISNTTIDEITANDPNIVERPTASVQKPRVPLLKISINPQAVAVLSYWAFFAGCITAFFIFAS